MSTRLDPGVKRRVYTSVAPRLCCSGAVLLRCCTVVLLWQHLIGLKHKAVALLYGAVLLRSCTVAFLCGAVLLRYCCVAVLLRFCTGTLIGLQHELLHHGVAPRAVIRPSTDDADTGVQPVFNSGYRLLRLTPPRKHSKRPTQLQPKELSRLPPSVRVGSRPE